MRPRWARECDGRGRTARARLCAALSAQRVNPSLGVEPETGAAAVRRRHAIVNADRVCVVSTARRSSSKVQAAMAPGTSLHCGPCASYLRWRRSTFPPAFSPASPFKVPRFEQQMQSVSKGETRVRELKGSGVARPATTSGWRTTAIDRPETSSSSALAARPPGDTPLLS
jgi:hypothetical protein